MRSEYHQNVLCCKWYSAHAEFKPRSWEKSGRSLPWAARKWLQYENKLGDRMTKQLLNSVIAKYRDLSVSRRSTICLSRRLIIDLLASDKSRYFAQPWPIIIVNYYTLNSLTLFWLAESVQWIFEISARDVITADYTIIMSRSRVIMSCMTAVHDFQG